MMRRPCRAMGLAVAMTALTGCISLGGGGAGREPHYKVFVSEGDSLATIASRYHSSPEAILALNQIKDVKSIRLGQLLKVPKAQTSEVASPRPEAVSVAADSLVNNLRYSIAPPAEAEPSPVFPAKRDRRSRKEPGKGLLFSEEAPAQNLRWPVRGSVSSEFGPRHGRLHAGIDVTAPLGASIFAAASGLIVESKSERGYGKMIVIRHTNGHTTLYGHLSKILKKAGISVKQGEEIARVGRSGNARGYHLHFEYRNPEGKALNPLTFLPEDRLVSFNDRAIGLFSGL